jgi:hypothetical protein
MDRWRGENEAATKERCLSFIIATLGRIRWRPGADLSAGCGAYFPKTLTASITVARMTTAMPITSVGKYTFVTRWSARTVNRLLAGSEIDISRESIDDDVSCVSMPFVLSVDERSAMTAAFAPNRSD